ncbi:MAG TPA: hypothetical protein VGO11_02530 [Chthoniobacteraceae bacterium]|nr:hypothetical protein [Chthoniobacteraceae bacterium]
MLETLRALPKAVRQAIGELIRGVCDSLGDVLAHRGLGVRDLGHGFCECRQGLKRRLIFEVSSAHPPLSGFRGTAPSRVLYFHTLGDHDEVRRFLKRHR